MIEMRLQGLIAAAHTPFDVNGQLNLSVIEQQAAHFLSQGVRAAFICGSTGESHSLTLEERRQIATRWREVVQGTELKLVVHVGCNCLEDAAELSAHAHQLGVDAIAALSPSYFKPLSLEILIQSMQRIAQRAAGTPFYFYDIPSMTGVQWPMWEFLERAKGAISNLVGLKFTNVDMASLQKCLWADGGRWDILWGVDESLLAAWSLGVNGAVGSSYNFCAPLHLQTLASAARSDWKAARASQYQTVRWIDLLARFGYLAAAKFCLECQGVPVGPTRLPLANLSAAEKTQLREILEEQGFLS